jgi:hypothetical protein
MSDRHNKRVRVDSAAILAAIAGAFLLAGFVKGVIGLGLPTVSIGLLGLLMTPAQAAAILLVPSLVTNVWQAAAGGGVLALLRRLWPMLAGICVGTFLGVALLPRDDSRRATVWLGFALTVYAGFGLMKGHFTVPRHMETLLGLLMSAATFPAIRSRQACAGAGPVVYGFDHHACSRTCLYRAHAGIARLAIDCRAGRGTCRHGAGATHARENPGRSLPAVLFRRLDAARHPSGAAWALVID